MDLICGNIFLCVYVSTTYSPEKTSGKPLVTCLLLCSHCNSGISVLQEKDLELCAINLKLDQLEAELQDFNSQESKDETSLAKVFSPNQLFTRVHVKG